MTSLARFATLATLLVACNVDGPERAAPRTFEPYVTDHAPGTSLPAVAGAPDVELEPGLEVRPAIRDGRMAIIPIVTTKPIAAPQFLTLQDGMKRGLVSVREMPTEWEVDRVKVTNHSHQPLYVASGEIITDAHQDRAMAEDRVITAGATVEMSVRCIESDRDYGDNSFAPGNALAELSIRKHLLHGSQTQVWDEVDRINASRSIHEKTKSYRHAAQQLVTMENPRRDRIAAELDKVADRDRMVGFAVAVDGQVIAMERYASPQLYREFEPRIVASYATHPDGEFVEGGRVTVDAMRDFARRPSSQTAASFTAIKH